MSQILLEDIKEVILEQLGDEHVITDSYSSCIITQAALTHHILPKTSENKDFRNNKSFQKHQRSFMRGR